MVRAIKEKRQRSEAKKLGMIEWRNAIRPTKAKEMLITAEELAIERLETQRELAAFRERARTELQKFQRPLSALALDIKRPEIGNFSATRNLGQAHATVWPEAPKPGVKLAGVKVSLKPGSITFGPKKKTPRNLRIR